MNPLGGGLTRFACPRRSEHRPALPQVHAHSQCRERWEECRKSCPWRSARGECVHRRARLVPDPSLLLFLLRHDPPFCDVTLISALCEDSKLCQ